MLYCLFYPKIEYRSIESLNLSNLQKMYKKQPSTPRSQNPIIFQDKLDSKDVFYRNIQIFKSPPFFFLKKKFDVGATPTLPSPNQWNPPPQKNVIYIYILYIYTHTPPLPWKAMPNINHQSSKPLNKMLLRSRCRIN